MEKEIWRPIKGYETYYEVSNYGNVRSVDRVVICSDSKKHSHKGRILKPAKVKNGYLQIRLSKSSEQKNVYIHRLVAQAFIPNPSNLPEINHKDEVKANNHVDNLEWCTRLYNMGYGTGSKRSAEKRKILLSKPVLQLDINTEQVISEYSSTQEAERQLKICHSNISACCKGKRETTGGFKWKYQE